MSLLAHATSHVARNIETQFHQRRLEKLEKLRLADLLQRKNPYLFRAKAVATASELVTQLIGAHQSSSEEALFGDFLEGLAIEICAKAFGGRKSATEGIDLEFERSGQRYLVSIKSGPNWGNSSQIRKMVDDFKKARKIAGGQKNPIIAVNGCCYGKCRPKDKTAGYLKVCGQDFWALISGREDLYVELIEPLGHQARERNEAFSKAYAAVLNRFTRDVLQGYCSEAGELDWKKLLKFNSGSLGSSA